MIKESISLEVLVSGVDGETHLTLHSRSVEKVIEFLKREDHEGAQVTLRLGAEDGSAYAVLNALREYY